MAEPKRQDRNVLLRACVDPHHLMDNLVHELEGIFDKCGGKLLKFWFFRQISSWVLHFLIQSYSCETDDINLNDFWTVANFNFLCFPDFQYQNIRLFFSSVITFLGHFLT